MSWPFPGSNYGIADLVAEYMQCPSRFTPENVSQYNRQGFRLGSCLRLMCVIILGRRVTSVTNRTAGFKLANGMDAGYRALAGFFYQILASAAHAFQALTPSNLSGTHVEVGFALERLGQDAD